MSRGKSKRLAWIGPRKKSNEAYKQAYEKIFKKKPNNNKKE